MEKVSKEWSKYYGINKSKLCILGQIDASIELEGFNRKVTLGVVSNETMTVSLLLGRNALKLFGYKLTKDLEYDRAVTEIFNIEAATVDKNVASRVLF